MFHPHLGDFFSLGKVAILIILILQDFLWLIVDFFWFEYFENLEEKLLKGLSIIYGIKK